MVKAGKLQVEVVVEIEDENQFPIDMNKWEQKITKRQVEYLAHTIRKNEIFGL